MKELVRLYNFIMFNNNVVLSDYFKKYEKDYFVTMLEDFFKNYEKLNTSQKNDKFLCDVYLKLYGLAYQGKKNEEILFLLRGKENLVKVKTELEKSKEAIEYKYNDKLKENLKKIQDILKNKNIVFDETRKKGTSNKHVWIKADPLAKTVKF
jgi:hypothetical protein